MTVINYKAINAKENRGASIGYNLSNIISVGGQGRYSFAGGAVDAVTSLIRFYWATKGPNWNFNTGWLTESNVDDWYGVTSDNGEITKLQLHSNSEYGLDNNLDGAVGNTLDSVKDTLSVLELDHNTNLKIHTEFFRNFINLDIVNLSWGPNIIGEINDFSNSNITTKFSAALSQNFTGTLNDISQFSSDGITIEVHNSGVRGYTSASLPRWNNANISIYDLELTQTEVDLFLCNLDVAEGNNGTLDISGSNKAPSSSGENCISNLIEKGWTITTSS